MTPYNVQTEDLVAWLDKMPKYLRLDGGKEIFVPIFYKHEWDGHSNAWFAMYAKEGSKYFNPTNCVLCVKGPDFLTTIKKFRDEFNSLASLGVVVGKEYFPEKLPEDERNKRYAYEPISGNIISTSI